MALSNPTKYVSVQRLSYFEQKLAAKYQTQAISAITGMTAETVEAALAELLGKINALPSAIIPKGSKAFASLAPATDLAAGHLGGGYGGGDKYERGVLHGIRRRALGSAQEYNHAVPEYEGDRGDQGEGYHGSDYGGGGHPAGILLPLGAHQLGYGAGRAHSEAQGYGPH